MLYGGSVKGNVQMTWTAGWSLATEFETDGLPLLYRAAADALRLQHAPPGDALEQNNRKHDKHNA